MVRVPAVLMLVPFSCNAPVALIFAPAIVPEAVILVAPLTAPAEVIPPLLLFIPPVIEAPPPETVKPLADVILPLPVVDIFPLVERTPFSLIVNLSTPPLCTTREVLAPALVSFITKALAVPALVKLNEVEVPLSDDSS